MTDAETRAQRDAAWWVEWFERDFTWEGLAKKPLTGWVVFNGFLKEADSGRIYGQSETATGHTTEGDDATLQDYWRADPATGRLRSDPEMEDELISHVGQPLFHCMHLPFTYSDGEQTEKNAWDADDFDAIMQARLAIATETNWEGSFEDGLVLGADGRAQFMGAVLISGLVLGDGSEAPLRVDCSHAAFVNAVSFEEASFSKGAKFRNAAFLDSTNFGRAKFHGDARFEEAYFSAEADFGGVTFSGSAHFGGATFSEMAFFKKARFEGPTTLNHAIFREDASFDRAIFLEISNFNSVQFLGEVTFRNVTFSDSASFNSAAFKNDASFERSAFLKRAEFNGSQFSAEAHFEDSNFSGSASFKNAKFSGYTVFERATFSDNANFNLAFFVNHTTFSNVSFLKHAGFLRTSFSGDARFNSVRYSGAADYQWAKFAQSANFERSQYLEFASFDNAAFGGRMSFSAATFEKLASFDTIKWPEAARDWHKAFDKAVFHGTVNFANAGFQCFAAFDGIGLERGLQYDEVSEQNAQRRFKVERRAAKIAAQTDISEILAKTAKDRAERAEFRGTTPASLTRIEIKSVRFEQREARLRELERGCRVLKLAMENTSNKSREQLFYRFELQARRAQKSLPFGEKTFSFLYETFSDFGASIWRPFFALAALIASFAGLFYGWGYWLDKSTLSADGWNGMFQALDLSWSNVFKPLSALSTENDFRDRNALAFRLLYNTSGSVDGQGFAVRAVSTLQSLLALVLAFLLALAVRRRFQIS